MSGFDDLANLPVNTYDNHKPEPLPPAGAYVLHLYCHQCDAAWSNKSTEQTYREAAKAARRDGWKLPKTHAARGPVLCPEHSGKVARAIRRGHRVSAIAGPPPGIWEGRE